MNPVILIGYRAAGPQRERLHDFCTRRWRDHLGWPIYEAPGPTEGPFCLAHASNAAARAATLAEPGWTVALYAGADWALAYPEQARHACTVAEQTGQLVICHDHAVVLDEGTTERLLTGDIDVPGAAGERHPNTFGGVVAFPRDLWTEARGMDERFLGWGGEDIAFWSACCGLRGYDRVNGEVMHLYHDRDWDAREGAALYPANDVLMRRYLAARGSRDAILTILNEQEPRA